MKSLKNHISVIFPLFVFLLSLQFTTSLEKIVYSYESKLSEDYSIIIVSSTTLKKEKLQQDIEDFASLELISVRRVLEKLKGDISAKNLSLLKVALPKFYSLKLKRFPNEDMLRDVKKVLKAYPSVERVETFAKTHNKIYRIFTLAKSTSYVFTFFIIVISMLLMLKQMRIWVYEHKERMEIMSLFGAPFWMKSAVLYKLASIDSLIATFLVLIVYYVLPSLQSLQNIALDIGVSIPRIDLLGDGLFLLALAFGAAVMSVSLVMISLKKV